MNKFTAMTASLLVASGAQAATYLLAFQGTVVGLAAPTSAEFASVQPGATVSAIIAFDTQLGVLRSDGATYIDFGAGGGNDQVALVRTQLKIGGVIHDVESKSYKAAQIALENDSPYLTPWIAPQDTFQAVAASTDQPFFAVPDAPPTGIRLLVFEATAPGTSNFITGPLTDIAHHVNFELASAKSAVFAEGVMANDPTVPGGLSLGSAPLNVVAIAIGKVTLQRCTHAFPWIHAGAPWPKELECN